jgi:hypothetical protein
VTIGAFDPWFTVEKGREASVNFATGSAIAGVCALLAGTTLARARRRAGGKRIPLEGWVLAVTGFAFAISIGWAIWSFADPGFDLAGIRYAAIPLAAAAAIGVLVLQFMHLATPRSGWRGLAPELCVLLLGGAAGAMPWANAGFFFMTAWRYPHGAAYSLLYLAAGLLFIAAGEPDRPRVWRAAVTIVVGLAAFSIAAAFDTWPPAIGGPDFRIFASVRLAGLYAAYACGVFTAIFGALQMRGALAAARRS